MLANVVVSKYLDGLPPYPQSAILAREGIEIERATLADWIGHAAWWLAPLAQLIGLYVMYTRRMQKLYAIAHYFDPIGKLERTKCGHCAHI